MPLWRWIERSFTFDFPPEKFPDLLERCRGTPPRVEAMVATLDQGELVQSDGKGWSIQQNIGHLIDTGYLPHQRIDEILAGQKVLCAADMSNTRTNAAHHNEVPIDELLHLLHKEREVLVHRLESLDHGDWGKSGLHPRINRPMRIVDIVYFDAEHDDYHLARIRELVRYIAESRV